MPRFDIPTEVVEILMVTTKKVLALADGTGSGRNRMMREVAEIFLTLAHCGDFTHFPLGGDPDGR